MICRKPYTQPQSPLYLSKGRGRVSNHRLCPKLLTASSTNPDCMPPRTNQIKAVAREAQIELWLATVQRALLEGLRIRNDAVAIVMEGRGSDTRGKFGLRAGKLWHLLREVARTCLGKLGVHRKTGLAAKKTQIAAG